LKKTKKILNSMAVGLLLLLMTMLGSCDIFGTAELTGTVEGFVIDVTTGFGIEGVSVSVLDASGSATTESDGGFSISVPIGSQTLVFTKTGYVFPNQEVSVTEGQTTTVPGSSIIGNPELESGEYRIVLTWNLNPADLDSHLLTPSAEHIYYLNPLGTNANLDVDDVTSYGPETITITNEEVGTYKYYVHRYSGTGTLAGSGALVRVFDTSGLVQSFTAPSSGTGDYWFVFTMNGGLISIVNSIQTSEPTF
jgi:hypothetical protein